MDQNVVVLSFAEESKAYQALSELKALALQQKVQLVNAAVVSRDRNGTVSVKDGASDGADATGPLTGTLIGALVGLLAGPLGVLLGSASGALIGSTIAIDKTKDRLSVLEQMMDAMPNGSTMLIATVGEYAQEVINGMVQKLDGSVMRRPLAVVQAEVDAQNEAQAAAAKEARRVLRGKQTEEWREKLDDWKDDLGEGIEKLKARIENAFCSDKKSGS